MKLNKLVKMKIKMIEKTIIVNQDLANRLEKVISNYPGLNLNVVVNQALEEWLRGPCTNTFKRDTFITDAPKGFGPELLKGKD